MRRTVRISTPIIGVASSMIIACPADMTGDGILDNGDLSAYVSVFLAQGPAADFSNDGIVDNGDISLFIEAYLAGCPTELAIKDTLSDPLNWTGTYALGPATPQVFTYSKNRTWIGYFPTLSGCINEVSFIFSLWLGGQPLVDAETIGLMFSHSLELANYASWNEVLLDWQRTDANVASHFQNSNVSVPVGESIGGIFGGYDILPGSLYQSRFDVSSFAIQVYPGRVNYLGLNTIPSLGDVDLYLQRALDASGVKIGPEPDYMTYLGQYPPVLVNSLMPDSSQSSVKIVIGPCDN